ncbi:uncharacterized protein [Leptinotarsa decemlineata]|uniref:uncharacterized protein n=1 Tax=Leptinotarsa decemlineata TaxID=7539 RepID=UPI003D303E9F
MSNYKFMFVCALVIVLGIMVAQTQQEGIRFGVDTGFQGIMVAQAQQHGFNFGVDSNLQAESGSSENGGISGVFDKITNGMKEFVGSIQEKAEEVVTSIRKKLPF